MGLKTERVERLCQPKLIAAHQSDHCRGRMAKSTNPSRYFDSLLEVIRTVVMMYVRYVCPCGTWRTS